MNQPTDLVNVTRHAIDLILPRGRVTIPPSGVVARVVVGRTMVETICVDGQPLRVERERLGAVVDLPAPRPGVVYLASRTVVDRARRPDVVRVADKRRDKDDRIIGGAALAMYPEVAS